MKLLLLRFRLVLGCGVLLAATYCWLEPRVGHAQQEPPANAFFHEFFGRGGYSDPQVEQNLKLGMMNGLTFSPPVETNVVRVTGPYGAQLMLRLAGAASSAGISDAAIAQQQADFSRLAATLTGPRPSWNLMPEWDQSGGGWVPRGRPRYTGLTRRAADAKFLAYYETAFPALMSYLRQPEDQRSYRLAAVTDHSPNVHHAFEMGVELQLLERGIDELGDLSTGLAYIRGAARQADRDWGIDFSSWRTFTDGATNYTDAGVLTGGWSHSYLRRLYYAAFAAGARTILNEAAIYRYSNGQLNPFGEATREFADFALRRHPEVAQPIVPVAILIDRHTGFDPKHSAYNQNNAVWYQDLPYAAGDYMLDNFFQLAFPGHSLHGLAPGAPFADAAGVPNVEKFRAYLAAGGDPRPYEPMPTTRWGDNFDVLTDAAPAAALTGYKVIVLLGDVALSPRLRADLEAWVRSGGTLVLNAAQVSAADEALLGVSLQSGSRTGSSFRWTASLVARAESQFTYLTVTPGAAAVLAVNEAGDPLITRNRVGAGEVYFTTADRLQPKTRDRILQGGVELFDLLLPRLLPVRVAGPPVEFIAGESSGKIFVTLVNNAAADWLGDVTFQRPPGSLRVVEYLSDESLDYRASRREVSVAVRVPAYDVRVIALETVDPLAANSAPVPSGAPSLGNLVPRVGRVK